jgi:alpha-beta hydrolase superfamily lysophospholipase
MRETTLKWLKRLGLVLAAVLVTVFAVRAWDARHGPQLKVWHTYVPDDLKVRQLDDLDWAGYLKAEQELFDEVRRNVTDQLEPEDQIPANRYFAGSPIYPGNFTNDWNRSYLLEPAGPPAGAVVLLHGLTDTPYSLRHVAWLYRDRGWVAVGMRMPGHGTVPAGLTDVEWEDWAAATRLAVREAKRRLQPGQPLHLVGFSNGGALAMQHALDALNDPELARPDRLILISPMIGVTAFARFAGVMGWPAVFPAFAKAAWLGVVPEFNPFKYNSFPINGARQSCLFTRSLQRQIQRLGRAGRLAELPPVLTFQSVVDFTVSTRAIITDLHLQLPPNGSELVLFDVNRNAKISPLLRSNMETALDRLLPPPPRPFRTTVIANPAPDTAEVVRRVTEAGATNETVEPLGLAYPAGIFSMSHVSIPFPVDDALYGLEPGTNENFGVNLGTISVRGEVGLLIVSLDSLVRVSSNPFYPYMMERIAEGIPAPAK